VTITHFYLCKCARDLPKTRCQTFIPRVSALRSIAEEIKSGIYRGEFSCRIN